MAGFRGCSFVSILSLALVFSAQPAFAVTTELNDRNEQAIQLIHDCLLSPRTSTTNTLLEVRRLGPGGPEYFNQVLDLLLMDSRPWAGPNDHRNSMLYALHEALPNRKTHKQWQGLKNSPLYVQIREKMFALLKLAPRRTHRQEMIINIYSTLKLWDQRDLPFFMQGLRIKRTNLVDPMATVLRGSRASVVRAAVEEAKKSFHFEGLAAMLAKGLLRPTDYADVLKLRLESVYFQNMDLQLEKPTELETAKLAAYRVDRSFAKLLAERDPFFMAAFSEFSKGQLKMRYERPRMSPHWKDAYLRALWRSSTPSFDESSNIISLKNLSCEKKLK